MQTLRSLTIALLTTVLLAGCGGDKTGQYVDDGNQFDDARNQEQPVRCTHIAGSVYLPGDESELQGPCFRIAQDLRIRGDSSGLQRLEEATSVTVHGDVTVIDAAKLENLDYLGSLVEVGGNLRIAENVDLIAVDSLRRLESVGGDVEISDNRSVKTVQRFDALRQVGGDIIVQRNDTLQDLRGFNELVYLAEYDSQRDRPDRGQNEDVGGGSGGFGTPIDPHLIVTDNPDLLEVRGFSELTDIDGDIRFEDNESLRQIRGFESLEFMTGRLVLRNLPNLESPADLVRTSCLSEIVIENVPVEDLSMLESLYEIGRLRVANNESLTGLDGLRDDVIVHGPLIVESNTQLSTLAGLDGLTEVRAQQLNRVLIEDEYSRTANRLCVALESDDQRGDVIVRDNDALTSLGEISLARVGNRLVVDDNDALESLAGLDALVRVGTLHIANNATLGTVDGPGQLAMVDSSVIIESNDALGSITGFDALENLSDEEFEGTLRVMSNESLVRFDAMPLLIELHGTVEFMDNPALTHIDGFGRLAQVGGLTLNANGIKDLDGLAGISRVAGDVTVTDNANLTNLDDFGAIQGIDNTLRISRNNALTRLQGMTSLARVGDGLVVQDNASLPSCEVAWLERSIIDVRYTVLEDNGPTCSE
jgi:hypothetical protein